MNSDEPLAQRITELLHADAPSEPARTDVSSAPEQRIAELEAENARLTAEVKSLNDKIAAALAVLQVPDPEDRRFEAENG